jgi:Tol biopolymer transport system component
VLVLAFLYFRSEPSQQEVVRLEIPQPDNTAFTSALSVSPDGRKLAYVAFGADGVPRLWVRSLRTFEAQPLAEAEGTIMPFWSPDSRFIAYGNAPDVDLGGKLFKIDATGGLAQVICDAPAIIVGGFWTGDGRIVFGGLGGRTATGGRGGRYSLATQNPGCLAP